MPTLNEEKFKLVGISIYGTKEFGVELICIDKVKSTEEKEHVIKLSCDIENQEEIIDILFKRLNIILYERFDTKYSEIEEYEYAYFSDFHEDNFDVNN